MGMLLSRHRALRDAQELARADEQRKANEAAAEEERAREAAKAEADALAKANEAAADAKRQDAQRPGHNKGK